MTQKDSRRDALLRRGRRARGLSLASGLALVLLLMGCQAENSDPAPGDGDISADQQNEIADGTITEDEYHAAFERFRACVAEGGYDLVVSGESYDLIDYAIPGAARDAGVDEPCYEREFAQTDTIWQLAHIDTSYIAERHRQCLVDNGIEPADTEVAMYEQLNEAGIDESTCFD